MIRNVLAEIWLTKPETARRVRQRIGAILDWAFANGYREAEAPMRSISQGLPRQPRNDGHHAALSETTDFPGELAEAALAHVVKDKTEAAYRRGTLLHKRRALMDQWATHCMT